jgi:pimeloyl-ACP methyl ester carboxylesterase
MRFVWLLLLVVAAGFAWLAGTGTLPRLVTAVRVLDHLWRPRPDSWLERATAPPLESPLTLEHAGRRIAATMYRPATRPGRVPVLFTPGAVQEGADDPRVAPFARALARAGFTVVVPDLRSFRTLHIEPAHAEELGAALEALASSRDLAPRGVAGIVGISYAGGVAMRVAIDPRHAARVSHVVAVGAFADLDSVVRFLATGRMSHRGRSWTQPPDPYGAFVFLRTYEAFIPSAADRAALDAMVQRRLRDPRAALEDLAAGLSSEARLVYDLFERAEPDDVPALLERLPEPMKSAMADLSPARHDFAPLSARLYLVHDRHDTTIPFTETLALADRARGHAPVREILLESLRHADPRPWHADPRGFLTRDLPEAWRLVWWWVALLGER